jgi:hypothetical protein
MDVDIPPFQRPKVEAAPTNSQPSVPPPTEEEHHQVGTRSVSAALLLTTFFLVCTIWHYLDPWHWQVLVVYFSTMLVLGFLGVLVEIFPSFHLPQFVKTPQREVDRYITHTLGYTPLTRTLSSFQWCLAVLYMQLVPSFDEKKGRHPRHPFFPS